LSIKVFYHEDHDGECAAAAIRLLIDENATFYGCNYNRSAPIDQIQQGDTLYIVDFSVEPAEMDKLIEKIGVESIIWIDHHKSAIEKYINYPHDIPGRRGVSEAACVLTWRYLMGDKFSTPEFVVLVGDYDSWHWNFGDRTRTFKAGLSGYSTKPDAEIWKKLYRHPPLVNNIIEEGEIIDRYLTIQNKSKIESWAYTAEIDGHEAIIINSLGGSLIFGDLQDKYSILATYIHDGEAFNVSLYSKTVDVRVIAEKYGKISGLGGGGHTGAAGFRVIDLPFENIKPLKRSES
jgi:oligoribonuclease NrnB/cAMP/cGMP phosphodiesterase (DHH superfamily)